jgi:hypothetical protein
MVLSWIPVLPESFHYGLGSLNQTAPRAFPAKWQHESCSSTGSLPPRSPATHTHCGPILVCELLYLLRSRSGKTLQQFQSSNSQRQESIRESSTELPKPESWVLRVYSPCPRDNQATPALLKTHSSQAPVAHTCNPSYSGGRDQEDQTSQPGQKFVRPCLENPHHKKMAGRVAQAVRAPA